MPGPPPGGPPRMAGGLKRASGSFNNVWSKPAGKAGGWATGNVGGSAPPPRPAAAPPPPASSPAPTWHYVDAQDKEGGPVGKEQLGRLLAGGTIMPSALVWNPSMAGWQPLNSVAELKDPAQPPPPPSRAPPPPRPVAAAAPPPPSHLAAAQEALATLALHESNARQAGQHEAVASWKAYTAYLTGLVQQLQGPGGAQQPAVIEQLKAGIAQVPPRPQDRHAMNAQL